MDRLKAELPQLKLHVGVSFDWETLQLPPLEEMSC
jgi:hypothetical protein